jgi:hypothetical protein
MTMDTSSLSSAGEDEISPLDLLLTLSQNIKLLIFGPLAGGLRAASADPASAAKLEGIRRALGLGANPQV